MSKRLSAILAAACLAALFVAPSASAFGIKYDAILTNPDGSPATQAGSHPPLFTTSITFDSRTDAKTGKTVLDEAAKDLTFQLPEGLVGNPLAVPKCASVDLVRIENGLFHSACPDSSAVGFIHVRDPGLPPNVTGKAIGGSAVYSMQPPPGVAFKLGFIVLVVPITVEIRVSPNPPYNLVATTRVSNVIEVGGADLSVWGNPSSPSLDSERGRCADIEGAGDDCPTNISETPLNTLPRSCRGAIPSSVTGDSWENPGVFASASSVTHDDAVPPTPLGMTGCGKLGFSPSIGAQPTTKAATSPTGLDFSLNVNDEGLTNPTGLAQSDIEKAVVTLPEGFSTNPSLAEGLEVCSEADLGRETVKSEPGAGCPNSSKIGTVEVETPLLEENVNGSLFIAKPYENPFNSLLAMYVVIKNPKLGIIVKQPLNVIPDPVTGQLTTVSEDMPQLPFSHFKLHFREGTRSPLASPPGCGTYNASAELYPYAGGPPLTTTSAFEIIVGPESKPCPSGGLPPFKPGLIAGTLNNAAGRYSPFNVRLFRNDSEQEITHFSIKLPPGVIGKLAGIPFCSDAAIAAAKARTGPHGGQEEFDNPSCPAASQIGRTLAGSGVGPSLAYAPGKLYLAGPYHGSAISLVSITAGIVGPFDIGTVVVREAFKIDPETAEVFLDATGSDPIPHIIKGIPVHLRDIRAYTDRPEFVMNPTGCERTSTASTLLGSGLDFGSEADDRPVTVSTPFQAADCAALKFEPKLALKLKGGTARGQHPAFSATLRMKGHGESNVKRAQVTLPRSEFLENAHIKTICTRVQFRAQACPAESIYGYAKATTPILDEPLSGPVYLRSSEHQLPDLVAELKNGQITVDLVGRVDSLNGRIRNTFEAAPDAPVKSFTLTMQGGKKGLLVNSTNICTGNHKVIADFTAHNGKVANLRPELQAKCGKAHKKGKGKAKHRKAG
jgi:hypothetical protein